MTGTGRLRAVRLRSPGNGGAQCTLESLQRSAVNVRIVKCPQCNADVAWTPDSKWRPFCSERCKLIDLGAWASERYRIETQDAPDASEGGGSGPER